MQHLNKLPKVPKAAAPKAAAPKAPANPLLGGMYKASSYGRTQNDALTFTRSGSNLLDFYAQAGAMRRSPEQALDLFKKAFAEDRQSALRVLFYLRDVRGGQGERSLFRNCLEWLGSTFPDIFEQILGFVPEYGRYDDMLFDNEKVWAHISAKLTEDTNSEAPSLLAKWLPTINASSATTRAKAKLVAERIGMSAITYRKTLRKLREKIKTVEELMSKRDWGGINYSGVPSQAARIYKKAFAKHDEKRYAEFVGKATTGEVKINAATLYPYQIYKDAHDDYSPTLEALWNQLPDYTMGKKALVVADTSGSMAGDPLAVSVSLALYFAERNEGPFKDHFLTFSVKPKLQRIVGKTLIEKMSAMDRADWDGNTDLEAAFRLILSTAVQNSVSPDDMPETLYVISDMEFDSCVTGTTLHEDLKAKYASAGYKLPNVVFWNVNASGRNMPVQRDESGVALVSGFSPVIFRMAVENKSPEQVMFDTINSPRYEQIVIK